MKKQLLNLMFAAALLVTATIVKAQYAEPVAHLEVPAATEVIELDGVADDAYTAMQSMTIAKREGAATAAYEQGDDFDFNAEFALTWDYNYLYLFLEVIDDVKEYYVVGKSESWTWDNVEIFIDLDTNPSTNTYSDTSTVQLRVAPGLMFADESGDSLVESVGRADYSDWKFWVDSEDPSGYTIEVAIPWIAAAAPDATMESFDIMSKITANEGVIGFDLGIADSDGDGSGDTGNRNTTGAGGAQMFWDLDTDDPLSGNEDNAYQNRRVFGMIEPTGTPMSVAAINQSAISVYPNPATDVVRIDGYFGSVSVYSVTGSKVMEIENVNESIDVSSLNSGVYFISTAEGTARILVQ